MQKKFKRLVKKVKKILLENGIKLFWKQLFLKYIWCEN